MDDTVTPRMPAALGGRRLGGRRGSSALPRSRAALARLPRVLKSTLAKVPGRRMIQVTLNGQPEVLDDGITVLALLERRQLAGKRLAVERNGEIVPKARHGETALAEGDRLEIVVAVGGG